MYVMLAKWAVWVSRGRREKIKGEKKDREGKEELKNNCIWCIFAYLGIDVIEHLHRCEGTRLLFIVQVHVNGVEEERGGRVRNRAQVSNLNCEGFNKIVHLSTCALP